MLRSGTSRVPWGHRFSLPSGICAVSRSNLVGPSGTMAKGEGGGSGNDTKYFRVQLSHRIGVTTF